MALCPRTLRTTVGLVIVIGLLTVSVFGTPQNSPRAQVTVENWDKGGQLSRWVYTHVSEVFPSAVIRRGGAIIDLPVQIRPEIGALKVNGPDEPQQTLDQFINNGAVDACIVLRDGKIVYEKYPTMQPNDLHIVMSVGKAVVLTALAILEDQGKIDIEKPVENYLPELKGSDWAETKLRYLVDMRSGMEGVEDSNDAYRNPKHKAFQLEATLGGQPRTAPELPEAARRGDLIEMLRTIKRERPAGEKWAYTSSNTAVIGEIVSRVSGKSLADTISDLIWSKIGAEHDATLAENERGYPASSGGMAATLRDVARFGLLFTKNPPSTQLKVISDAMVKRIFGGRGEKADEHGMLPQIYEWDMISDQGELAKGGWAGQLLYINREKNVVVGWFGTNLVPDPKVEPLPCRMIAKTFKDESK
ncbi:MAG TPA: serine hydrolase domain-containing protein [Candidatus Udaeobacter sp.]|nr:serine hydrolase domain-containing protein [Candidatus Udaeobacter sp.]